jgi:hypothetical protein
MGEYFVLKYFLLNNKRIIIFKLVLANMVFMFIDFASFKSIKNPPMKLIMVL